MITSIKPIKESALDANNGPIVNNPKMLPANASPHICLFIDIMPPSIVKIERKKPTDPQITNKSLIDSAEKVIGPYSEDIDSNSGTMVVSIRETFIDASPTHIRTERAPAIIIRMPAMSGFEILFEDCWNGSCPMVETGIWLFSS